MVAVVLTEFLTGSTRDRGEGQYLASRTETDLKGM
jgi:hypothetical protein